MPADKVVIGARLRAAREAREWSRAEMARRLRDCSVNDKLPDVKNLAHMIKEWENARNGVSPRYQRHFAATFGVDREMLFGDERALTVASGHDATYTEQVGTALRSAIGEAAEFAGWVFFDSGDQHRARHYYLEAMLAAHVATTTVWRH